MRIHYNWYEEIKMKNKDITNENIDDILKSEIGNIFTKVLEHCGVFKWDDEGKQAIERYIESLKLSID